MNNDVSLNEKALELGVIISDRKGPTHLNFTLQLRDEADISVGEYVEVPIGTKLIIGRVDLIHAINEAYENPLFIKDHLLREIPLEARFPTKMMQYRAAQVRIVGVIDSRGKVNPPNEVPEPGKKVYLADPELLNNFLGLEKDGIFVGTMYGNSKIKVVLNPKLVIGHHIAVLGATGSGKSYTVGVIIEELLDAGIPVVVIDPHGEYYGFAYSKDGVTHSKYDIYHYRLFDKSGTTELLRINLNNLNADSIAELIGATDVQADLLFLMVNALRKAKQKITIKNLLASVENIASEWNFAKRTQLALKRRLMLLEEMNIISEHFDIRDLVHPGALTIVDLSEDIEEKTRQSLVGILLDNLFKARKNKEIPPLLVVVEESHRFAPQDYECYSKYMMRKIVREGRKFGIGLCITSQRLVGLDKDVLSQCGTKFILRIDSKTDLDYIRPFLDYTSTSDLDRIPYMPNGVAVVTGVAVRAPIVTNIRTRKTKHIGETTISD